MNEWGWSGNSDFSWLISVDEESKERVTKENNSWETTRVSLKPALKCGACGSRIFVVDYCCKTFAETPMTSNEMVSLVREDLQDHSCSRCGAKGVQLVWIGETL